MFNEGAVLIVSYFLPLFTDYTEDVDMKYFLGNCMIGVVIMTYVSNVFLVIYVQMKPIIMKLLYKHQAKKMLHSTTYNKANDTSTT